MKSKIDIHTTWGLKYFHVGDNVKDMRRVGFYLSDVSHLKTTRNILVKFCI